MATANVSEDRKAASSLSYWSELRWSWSTGPAGVKHARFGGSYLVARLAPPVCRLVDLSPGWLRAVSIACPARCFARLTLAISPLTHTCLARTAPSTIATTDSARGTATLQCRWDSLQRRRFGGTIAAPLKISLETRTIGGHCEARGTACRSMASTRPQCRRLISRLLQKREDGQCTNEGMATTGMLRCDTQVPAQIRHKRLGRALGSRQRRCT